MCCMVLKCMKCTVSVMWMWWSCNEYVYNICSIMGAKNGMEINKIYFTMCSGLVMNKMCKNPSNLTVKMIN